MSDAPLPEFKLDVEIDRFFDDSSIATSEPPRIVILAGELDLTYKDIFDAAAEALVVADSAPPTHKERMEHIHQLHPRAYEPWTAEEDARLTQLSRSGQAAKEIAEILQRQPGAIQSRLAKLNLAAST